uniref:CSON014466 protein n=1 Tax=Culicoides sonorensis TaxID=179676 RepID=A0A336MBN5_CULSO
MSNYDSINKIWSSNNQKSIFNPETSVGEIVLYSLERTPDKICEISDDYGSFLTCLEVRKRSIQVAKCLTNIGVKFGDICAIVSKNNPEVSSVAFGCLFIGSPLNTLDPSFDQKDFCHMLGLTRPKIIFAESSVVNEIQSACNKIKLQAKIYCFTNKDGTVTDDIDSVKSLFDPNHIIEDFEEYFPVQIPNTRKHIAFIICSSGTSGLSKGVCTSHAQIVAQTLRFWPIHSSDTIFAFSSLYWITGIMTLLRGVVEGSIRINTCQPFTPEYYLKLIEKHRITNAFVPPSQMALMLECEDIKNAVLSSFQRCYTGGSFVLEELRMEFEKQLGNDGKVIVGYGMSEIASSCTINFKRKPGSVGGVVNEHQIKIVSEDGESLGPGEKGEICILPPVLFLGYYGNEEQLNDILDSEGWLHSGDLGYFDSDGYLFIVGRKKEMIKFRNHQIAPGDIEGIVQQTTGLNQVCAVAIEDHRHGTDLPAVVLVRPMNFHLNEEQIINVLDKNLTDIKKLRGGVYFVAKLPMTPSGKVLRRLTKELANNLWRETLEKEK